MTVFLWVLASASEDLRSDRRPEFEMQTIYRAIHLETERGVPKQECEILVEKLCGIDRPQLGPCCGAAVADPVPQQHKP